MTRAGPRLFVKSIQWHRRAEGYTVYNFEVEALSGKASDGRNTHSYFVGKTDGGAWVHNANYTTARFDVGSYNALKNGARNTGLEIHHLPQANLGEQAIAGYDRLTGLSIALPSSMHRRLPATSRLAGDLSHLEGTELRMAVSQQLRDLKNAVDPTTGASVPISVMRSIGTEMKTRYPGLYVKP